MKTQSKIKYNLFYTYLKQIFYWTRGFCVPQKGSNFDIKIVVTFKKDDSEDVPISYSFTKTSKISNLTSMKRDLKGNVTVQIYCTTIIQSAKSFSIASSLHNLKITALQSGVDFINKQLKDCTFSLVDLQVTNVGFKMSNLQAALIEKLHKKKLIVEKDESEQ